MNLEEHESQALKTFGKPWTEVHKWLDEFAFTPQYGMRHRRVRHHRAGVEEARKLFGDEGADAALQHIKSDLHEEGWREGHPFPWDEKSYVSMGLF